MASYPRAELEEMVQRWLAANVKSQTEGNWRYLADYFTEDAYYCWDIPGGLYQAKGRENIRATCMGDAMDPYKGWTYPYFKIVIDEHIGEIMVFWWQTPPTAPSRADGTPMHVLGTSWFKYGGNYQWSEQRDLYDFGKTMEFIDEVAEMGLLSDLAMQRKRDRDKAMLPALQAKVKAKEKSVAEAEAAQ